MKKSIKILFIILMLLFCTTRINALDLSQSEYEEYNIKRAYVVGKYIFDLSKHNPTLKDLMLAAQSSPTGDVSIIEIKIATNIDGEETKEYRELLEGRKLTEFPDLNVDYIYMSEIKPSNPETEDKIILSETGSGDSDDITAPVCTWSTISDTLEIGKTEVITLTCTDESGIKTNMLSSSVFAVEPTNSYVIENIIINTITNGYEYVITLNPKSAGTATISLKEDSVKDNNGNSNALTTSESFEIKKYIKGTFNLNGEKSLKFNGKEYTQSDINEINLNGQTSLTYGGSTYTKAQLDSICAEKNDKEFCAITFDLCTVEEGNNCQMTLPEIIPNDETKTVLGYSVKYDSTNPILYNSKQQVTLNENIPTASEVLQYAGQNMPKVLYAQVENEATKRYTAIFRSNNEFNEVVTLSCTVASGENSCSIELPENSFVYGDWEFIGWSEDATAHTGEQPGTSVDLTSNVTYYAIWMKEEITYRVTFNGNGATGSMEPVSCTIPAVYNGAEQEDTCTVTLPNNTGFTYEGWTFMGWSEDRTMDRGMYDVSYVISEDKTVYAIWKKTLDVKFTKGKYVSKIGATSTTCNVYNGSTSGCQITLPTITPEKGYSVVGWFVSDGTISAAAPSSQVTVYNNVTITAEASDVTKPTISCTISNNNTTMTKVTVEASDSTGLLADNPSGTYYVTSTTQIYTVRDSAGNTASCTVTSKATPAQYVKETFNCTVGTWGTSSTDSYVGSCSSVSKSSANGSNSNTYTECTSITGSVCMEFGFNSGYCYKKSVFNRTGCSTYSSSASSSTNVATCTESANKNTKTTCTVASYNYDASVSYN